MSAILTPYEGFIDGVLSESASWYLKGVDTYLSGVCSLLASKVGP